MRKVLSKIKDFCKKYIIFIAIGILIIGILFIIFNKSNVDSIRRVKKVLGNKYYKIECMNESCDYIIAYKGNKIGKTNILIYNASGKKIASYNEIFNSNTKIIRNIFSITNNYIIFKKDNVVSGKTDAYVLASNRAKEKYNTKNLLSSLNNNLISEKIDESYNILNYNGKTIYTNVTNIETYANGKIISAKIGKEDVLLNEKGNTILNGYSIAKQVKDENGKTIYLILQDSNKNYYYYYNINNNSIVGDSFNEYVEGSNKGELVVTKNVNNSSIKYVLKKDGKLEELNSISLDVLKNIDSNKYKIVYESYIISSQQAILVQDIKNNTFGTYNIKTNKYNKLFTYNGNKKVPSISKLLSTEKDLYLQMNCSADICSENKLIIYDMVNDKELYETTNRDYMIQYYTNYEDYNVVKYSSNSSDEYKNKYAIYDKDNNEIFKSDNQIVIVDKKLIFGKEPSNNSLILYSVKEKKALNDSNSLASKITLGKSYFYKYSNSEKTYLYNSVGDRLKVINFSKASLIYSLETVMYVEKNKVFIINPTNNKSSVYNLKENEKIYAEDGSIIPPYRNTLFINNTINNNIKIVNVNGRVIKNIKKSNIESVNYNKNTKNVIIVTKKVKNNNNYYGLYIGK